MSTERWVPVVGYEGLYEVSDHGRIRGVDRVDSRGHWVAGTVLKQALKPNGRMQVRFSRNGHGHCYLSHRVVARAFLGPAPAGTEVLHGDGDPTNNRVMNLRWGTSSENKLDSVRHGTHSEARKTHCPMGHALVAPNLVPAHAARGSRDCRACAAARQAARRRGVALTAEMADERFARIMRAA